MNNGVLLMGAASLALLFYTGGHVTTLVIMYSINVFLDFSLSQAGMIRYFVKNRQVEKDWRKEILIFGIGFTLCLTILTIAVVEKFAHGGWLTLVITTGLIVVCYRIRNHYETVRRGARQLDEILLDIPVSERKKVVPVNPREMTAIVLVNGYNGFGVHTLMSVIRNFPRLYKNFIFVSAAVVDSGAFKGSKEIDALKASVEKSLQLYVDVARDFGLAADYRCDTGTEAVETVSELCLALAKEFPRCTVFTSRLIFSRESVFQRFLHNETPFAIQRRLQWQGITTVVLPIRTQI
jgi:K+ transporter